MKQRDENFKGGIQDGTTAFDDYSRQLDTYLKECREEIGIGQFEVHQKLSKEMKLELVGADCFGFAPDGGAWFKDGKMVAVFEAKKQGKNGNAYERWWDNAVTAKHINPDVTYVTFCIGEGAAEGNCLNKLKQKAEIMMGENYVFYNQTEPFTKEQIRDIMTKTLSEIG